MAGSHKRNIGPMQQSPRCGAKTRTGARCKAPAANGKARCRMHGGAVGSGAPRFNQNALKHGYYTAEEKENRRRVRRLLREAAADLKKL